MRERRHAEPATLDDVRQFQLGALESQRDRFAARVGEGRIREGHGDLRLEHVYFLPPPDGIVAIDCVEFSERSSFDLAVNIEAAREVGMAAVHFRSNEQAIPEIRELLRLGR